MKGRIAALEARLSAPPPPDNQRNTDEDEDNFDLFGDEVKFFESKILLKCEFCLTTGRGRGKTGATTEASSKGQK